MKIDVTNEENVFEIILSYLSMDWSRRKRTKEVFR